MLEIVAELSANHLGSLDRALRIVHAAADAGADLFKVQVWSPDTMCIDHTYELDRGPWKGRNLMGLYREAWTPWDWLPLIFQRCRDLGMEPFGSAFDNRSVEVLEGLGVKRHKVASFELVDLPLIRYMASKGKPMILSTGMATNHEVWNEAWLAVRDGTGNDIPITVLKCTSAYPADASEANLATYGRAQLSHNRWGLSDHTPGIGVACAAAALGAVMIEKHLTLSRADGGPDAGFSLEPHEFKQLATECRRAAESVGEVRYGPTAGEDTSLRRSLWVCRPIYEGDLLELGRNICTARPAKGLPCSTPLAGRRARWRIPAGVPLEAEMITDAPPHLLSGLFAP